MDYKLVLIFFVVVTLFVCVVEAGSSAGGIGGIHSFEQEQFDPYTRMKYFGVNYVKPVFGYGLKNGVNVPGNFGREGAGGVRNKLYNSMILQGRNPGIVSHYDSAFKGSKDLDLIVDLKPVYVVVRDNKDLYSNGFARIVSQEYDQNSGLPYSEIDIFVVNAVPSIKNETMGAWLVDENTGYVLHLGNFLVNLEGSASFSYRVYQFFGPYTSLILTREPLYPTDPFPHEVEFVGSLKK